MIVFYFLFNIWRYNNDKVQMNTKHNQILPQSKSYHHLHRYHFQPLSPLNKISTPHKLRNQTFNTSMNSTPINFSTALNNFKSPNNQENIPNNSQSPMY